MCAAGFAAAVHTRSPHFSPHFPIHECTQTSDQLGISATSPPKPQKNSWTSSWSFRCQFLSAVWHLCVRPQVILSPSGCNTVMTGKLTKPATYISLVYGPLHRTGRTLKELFSHGSKTCYIAFIGQFITTVWHRPASALIMLLLFAEGIALYGVSWVLWRIFGRFIIRSPLDNIPGPPSKSWSKGMKNQTELDVNDG